MRPHRLPPHRRRRPRPLPARRPRRRRRPPLRRPKSPGAPASSASARFAPSVPATASSPTTRRSPTPASASRDAALVELRSLLGRHLGIVPAPGTGLDSLWSDAEFQAVRERLAAEEPRTPDAPVSFRLADPRLVPEGIAWDGARKRFLVGSIAQRKIVVVDRGGKTRDFSRPEDGLDAVLGLAVDGAPPPALRCQHQWLRGQRPQRPAQRGPDLRPRPRPAGRRAMRWPKHCSSTTSPSPPTARSTSPTRRPARSSACARASAT